MIRHRHHKGLAEGQGSPVGELDPGTQNGWYDITDGSGGGLGTLVEMAGSNVTQGGNTWYARQAYWFWLGNRFPSSFQLVLHAYNSLPTLDPTSANPITTTGPFDTTTTYPPVTGGNWWTIQKSSGGNLTNIGWLNINNGTQTWYESSPNAYLTIGGGEALVFTGSQTGPSNAMYRAIATPVG